MRRSRKSKRQRLREGDSGGESGRKREKKEIYIYMYPAWQTADGKRIRERICTQL